MANLSTRIPRESQLGFDDLQSHDLLHDLNAANVPANVCVPRLLKLRFNNFDLDLQHFDFVRQG